MSDKINSPTIFFIVGFMVFIASFFLPVTPEKDATGISAAIYSVVFPLLYFYDWLFNGVKFIHSVYDTISLTYSFVLGISNFVTLYSIYSFIRIRKYNKQTSFRWVALFFTVCITFFMTIPAIDHQSYGFYFWIFGHINKSIGYYCWLIGHLLITFSIFYQVKLNKNV